jgi:F420-0:gamma-glutamyl ligase
VSELNEIECGDLCQTTIEALHRTTGGLKNFPGLLKKIIETQAWKKRVTRGRVVELKNLRELITQKPITGWGEDPKKVEAVIKDDPEVLRLYREAMLGEEGGNKRNQDITGNNVISEAERTTGNSRAYSIDRVVRECEPEIVQQVMSGKLSPNAALVKSGIRENRQVYIPRDPAKALEKLRESFGEEFVNAIVECAQK